MYTHKPFEKHSETWTNAGNTGNRSKERKENFGSQLSVSLKWAPKPGTEAVKDSIYLISAIVLEETARSQITGEVACLSKNRDA